MTYDAELEQPRCPACGRYEEHDAEGFYDAGLHLEGCEDPDPTGDERNESDQVKEDEVSQFGGLAVFCNEACADRFHHRKATR